MMQMGSNTWRGLNRGWYTSISLDSRKTSKFKIGYTSSKNSEEFAYKIESSKSKVFSWTVGAGVLGPRDVPPEYQKLSTECQSTCMPGAIAGTFPWDPSLLRRKTKCLRRDSLMAKTRTRIVIFWSIKIWRSIFNSTSVGFVSGPGYLNRRNLPAWVRYS